MKLKSFFNSIAFQISISIIIVVTFTTIAVGWVILREEKKPLEAELKSKGRYLAELMSHRVVEPLLYEEQNEIFSLLQSFIKGRKSLVVYGEVYDKNGKIVVSAYKDEKFRAMAPILNNAKDVINSLDIRDDNNFPFFHISLPIKVETLGDIGFLRLGITKEPLYITLKRVNKKLYFLAVSITFFGIMLGLIVARRILNPILILNKGVKMVGDGEVGVEVPVVGEGEVKELALSFNRMSVKLKELINTIKSAQEHLVRTEKLYAIGEFSAGMAHEIKNPLTSIKMLLQTVMQKRESLSSTDIAIIEGEINRIDHIVKQFLAFARPERADKTYIDINEVLKEVITITEPKMKQSAIHLEQTLSPSLPAIKGNHDALKQVFLNIVLNAMQAMNGWSGRLSIKTTANEGTLSVIISDTGTGITEENMKKIFDPFFTTKEEGTGMGLTLTHGIINDHYGKIDIDSTPGKGTRVKVELPLPD